MNVRFYKNFVKKYNSTKRPTGAYTELDCKMKEECSVKNPVLYIDGIDLDFNYCIFNNRYYFVEDIILNKNNIYEIRCSIDILATYKPNISSYIAFVERSSSTYDPYLNDKELSQSSNIVTSDVAETNLTGLNIGTDWDNGYGCYVIPVMNKNGVDILLTRYLDDVAPLFQHATYGLNDFTSWFQNGMASLMNLNTYFGKVVFIPFKPSGILNPTQAGSDVFVGPLQITFEHECYYLSDPKYSLTNALQTVNKPDMYYNDFRDMDRKYSRYTLYLAGIGEIELDPFVVGNPNIDIKVTTWFAPATGDLRYKLYAYHNPQNVNPDISDLGTYYGSLSYTIPWGDSQWGVKEWITGILNTGEAMANGFSQASGMGGRSNTGTMTAGFIGAWAKGYNHVQNNDFNFLTSKVGSVSGGEGSPLRAITGLNLRLSSFQMGSTESPNAVSGRPLYKNRQLGTLSGFIECSNASLDIAGFEDEKIALNNFLNSGFYFE